MKKVYILIALGLTPQYPAVSCIKKVGNRILVVILADIVLFSGRIRVISERHSKSVLDANLLECFIYSSVFYFVFQRFIDFFYELEPANEDLAR